METEDYLRSGGEGTSALQRTAQGNDRHYRRCSGSRLKGTDER